MTYKNIFEFWRAVEAMTPQDAAKLAPGDRSTPVYSLGPDDVVPWQATHPHLRKTPRAGHAWRYTVQSGIYNATALMGLLEGKIGRHPDVFEERGTKICRLFDIAVDKRGVPVAETFVLSMAGWAAGAVFRMGVPAIIKGHSGIAMSELPMLPPNARTGDSGYAEFDELQARLREAITLRLSTAADVTVDQEHGVELIPPVDRAWFDALAMLVIGICRLPASLFCNPIGHHVKCYQARDPSSTKTDSTPRNDDELLNSFFIGDLKLLARATNLNDGLARYIAGAKAPNRVDVRTPSGKHYIARLVDPAIHPIGRWPSDHPLAYSQQVALNEAWHGLRSKQGIFGVNGPPGTGKTTLLRDVVAAVVVARAKCLSELDNPAKAFAAKKIAKVGDTTIPYYPLAEALEGHAILVASCNNGAVENVTLELPTVDAISTKCPEALNIDYFTDLATEVLGRDAWGLLAARLGNRGNCTEFASKFWWGQKTQSGSDSSTLRDHLNDLIGGKRLPKQSWSVAVGAFNEAIRKEQAVRATLVIAAALPKQLDDETRLHADLASSIAATNALLADIARRITGLIQGLANQVPLTQAAEKAVTEHRIDKPGVLEWLTTLGRSHREWRQRLNDLISARNSQQERAGDLASRHATAITEQTKAEVDLAGRHQSIAASDWRLADLQKSLQYARNSLGDAWPDENMGDEALELCAPWATPEWNTARTNVFIAALALHRAFIEAVPSVMRANLSMATDWLAGKHLSPEMKRTALNSLTVVVPVISATFASVGRMLQGIEAETIGWLLIDEAGQAMPQQAAGAIWRARRTIVVGDPLQLEPVATIPATVEGALAQAFSIDQRLWPSLTSVQELADRVTPIGTYLPSDQDSDGIWVGAPLRVHRRCLEPMFSISNQVAYDGLMIHGRAGEIDGTLPESGWIDVRGTTADGHWVREEGVVVELWLTELRDQWRIESERIFMISPFRDVAKELRSIGRHFQLDAQRRVGTVHTTQGKESDIVILVLGGNPSSKGAKAWAAQRPNLLNVAVSRAKKRLYVVGNRAEWRAQKYFSVMDRHLPELHVHRSSLLTR